MDPKETLAEMARIARRRLPLLVLTICAGLVLAVAVAMTRPPVYEARAKILVERPRIADELARSTVNLSAAARLQLIEEQLMARENLRAVLERWKLFDIPGLSQADRLESLREAARIESISTATGQNNPWEAGNAGLFAFTITITLDDAEKAAAIANEFADEAVARNRLARADQAGDTLAYFQAEDSRLASRLAAKEAEIAAFKQRHADTLPESLESRRDTLDRLRENLLETDRRVMELEEKLADLEAVAAGERPVGDAREDPGETRLRELELALSTRQGTLAPTHPEIRRLTDQIAALKALLKPGTATSGAPAAGPASERRTAIARQSAQVSSQIKRLAAQSADMTSQAEALEASIRATPGVATELDALSSGLSDLRSTQADVTRRTAEARTGAELEASEQSERFQVIESAEVPELPVGPDRRKMVAAGAVVALAAAGGLALALERLNPAPRTAASMERQLGLRPVVTIPYVYAPGERRARRLRWALLVALLGLGLGFGLPALEGSIAPLRPAIARLATASGLGPLLPLALSETGDTKSGL